MRSAKESGVRSGFPRCSMLRRSHENQLRSRSLDRAAEIVVRYPRERHAGAVGLSILRWDVLSRQSAIRGGDYEIRPGRQRATGKLLWEQRRNPWKPVRAHDWEGRSSRSVKVVCADESDIWPPWFHGLGPQQLLCSC